MSDVIFKKSIEANSASAPFLLRDSSLAIHAVLTATGAGAATIAFQVTNFPELETSWIDVDSLEIEMAGSDLVVNAETLETPFAYGRLIVSGLTGTDAKVGIAVTAASGGANAVNADSVQNVRITNADGVTFEVDEADLANVGAKADAAASTDNGTFSLIALTKRLAQNITSMSAKLPASLGIKTATNSLSVAPASDASFAISSAGVGAPADAVATTDTGTFSLVALVKRSLQNWSTLLGLASTTGVKVVSGPGGIATGTVPQSASVAHIDVDFGAAGARLGHILFPANIGSATVMTFALSHNGTDFFNLYDEFGVEYSIKCSASQAVVPTLTLFAAARYVRFRFGTAAAPTTDNTITRVLNIGLLS